MRSPSLHVLLLSTLLISAPAILAHDITISGTQTFASLDGSSADHDGSANGVFTVNDGNLAVNGTVNCNDEGVNSNSGCPMAFAVSGNMTINSGAALYAENRTAGGTGGAITLTVGGNLALNGTAIVSSASTSGNGGNGGAISATVTGTVTLASGTTIDAGSANATGGNITIAGSAVSLDGNVYSGPSRTLLSTRLTGAALDGGKNNQIGGTISISSTTYTEPAIVIGANANVISQGDQSGTGGITINGCGVEIRGLVAALSLKESAAKVTLRSGKSLLVDSRDLGGSGTRMGRVRADAPTGSAVNKGVDLFARQDIQILGAPTSGSLFAVSSIPGSSKSAGGLIRVISLEDAVTASAKAIDAGQTLAGDQGGTVEISAEDDVNLDTAVIDASGDYTSNNSSRAGGSISVRSYSGDVIWTNGSGDVRPIGSTSGIALADQGTIVLTACGTVDTTGSTFPVNGTATSVFPETHTGTCSPAAPSLPSGVSALMTCNTLPVANDLTPSTNEDNSVTITLSGTDADGDSLTFTIVSGPSHGTLGTIISTGPTTATVDYSPALNYNGSDSFVYRANDGNGGTDDANASITVVAVNDPPTFTIGAPVTVLEDSGAQTFTSWITAISPGPSDESGQTVTFIVTNDNNALFSVQPAVDSAGNLTFTPAANANGSATITVTAQDSGGIANGGDDTSNPLTSSIAVTPVNDAPSFACGANVIADSNGGAFSQANWASAISAGPADESGQTLTFEITANSSPAIFSVQPAVSAGGTLTFTPVAGASGSSSITLRLHDGGGIANGGVDVSASCSFTITVDAAPFVSSTSPANGAGPLASNINLVITYSEPVTAGGTAYTIKCTPSNLSRPFVLSGNGTATHTLDPNSNLQAGQTCTVSILASQITDVDSDDPPNNMTANYSFSFSIDANPQIVSTSPNGSSVNVATNANQTITWTEAVNMTTVNISCTTSGAHTSVLSTSDNITWTADPDTDFSPNETCTVTVLSASVTDVDTNDPPDNPGPDISWSFTTDAAPSVTATSPVNGAANLASNTNIVITYDEPVNASGTAYTITCTPSNSNRPFVLSGNGTATHTLDPNINLPAGQTCTVTVLAAQITDVDAGDPPDNMAANYVFSFTTDANPQITTISPNDGSTNVATNANTSITWTEAVTMTSVNISCATSGAHNSTLSTSDSITWTVDPDTDYSPGELCTMTVLSATVTDNDTNDPPDNPGPDISWSFTTDAAPSVTATSPVNGAANLASNTNIVITYDEPVTASGAAYTIVCNTNRTFVLTGNGTATHTLDPNSNLSAGQTCTVTVFAAQITDVDAGDPPDNMTANYVFSFSVDANPQIQTISPNDGSTGVATNANTTITWTEAVNMTTVNISCTTSGSHTSVLSTSNNITWTVDPDIDFSPNETCTITVLSASVTDVDANDPPDNPGPDISWSFTTDSAPSVTATSPANGAANLASNTNIVITWDEPVTASGTAYTIVCNTNRTFVLSGNGTATHTLDPNSNLTAGQTCTVTVLAAQITDVDAGDPPDNMTANYVFSFSVDANPQIQAVSPNDGSTGVATNANTTITWTEAVNMTTVNISCTTSGSHTSVLSTSNNITWTVDPDIDFSPNETCTITVLSASVTDVDANDPPDNPGPDISWQFTTDAAPSVTATSPVNGATNLAQNTNIVITYSEPVTASGTAYTITCPSNRTFVLSGNGTATHTLDPTSNLVAGQTCTVTIMASQITDLDAGDPPDNMTANYVFSFSVDANPQIQAVSPNDGSTGVATNTNITITFTESVSLTGVSISCASSGAHTSTLSASPAVTFTVNPDVDFSPNELCTVTVLSANVTDTDINDPPDNMGPDVSWQFITAP